MTRENRYRLRWVDVFTERALAGNPLAVVLDPQGLTAEQMQAIARETNLSETTFVLPPKDRRHAAHVRIFTPHVELPFAGHPTIGTGWVLLNEGVVAAEADHFTLEEGVGPVPLRIERDGPRLVLWMTHPPVKFGSVIEERSDVAAALGLTTEQLTPDVPIQVVETGLPFVFVALKNREAVDAAVSSGEALTAVFAPHTSVRIGEDPATGSASGPLGAFAVRYGLIRRATRLSIMSEQGTKMGRQSFVHIELEYPPEGEAPSRIEVGGSVVPVMTAELTTMGP